MSFYIDVSKVRIAQADQLIGTNAELAEKAGVSRQTLSGALNGKSCTLKTVQKVASALDCTPSEIQCKCEEKALC